MKILIKTNVNKFDKKQLKKKAAFTFIVSEAL